MVTSFSNGTEWTLETNLWFYLLVWCRGLEWLRSLHRSADMLIPQPWSHSTKLISGNTSDLKKLSHSIMRYVLSFVQFGVNLL